MSQYPKYKYHVELEPAIVDSPDEERDLGSGWEDSPADHGVITNPSKEQARKIAQEAFEADKDGPRKVGRPKKVE